MRTLFSTRDFTFARIRLRYFGHHPRWYWSEKSEPAFTLYQLSTITYYKTINFNPKEKARFPRQLKQTVPSRRRLWGSNGWGYQGDTAGVSAEVL